MIDYRKVFLAVVLVSLVLIGAAHADGQIIADNKDNTYDVYMSNSIGSTDTTIELIHLLKKTKWGDTITFHLAGYGGQVDTVAEIVNAANKSKANLVILVEGPVYSGHAYLAVLLPGKLHVDKYSYLMFHYSSILNDDCSSKKGFDRGVSEVEHCTMFRDAHTKMFNKMLDASKYLTQKEKTAILLGHDVYLHPEDIAKRGDK